MARKDRSGGAHHSKRQGGLRNRNRTGRSTYSKKNKRQRADSYGTWSNGNRTN